MIRLCVHVRFDSLSPLPLHAAYQIFIRRNKGCKRGGKAVLLQALPLLHYSELLSVPNKHFGTGIPVLILYARCVFCFTVPAYGSVFDYMK